MALTEDTPLIKQNVKKGGTESISDFQKIQFPEIKGKFTIIMRRRPSEDQGCLLVRHLFYSMSQIPFMVEDGGHRLSGSQERRSTYDMRTEDGYKELYAELRGYEEKGVDIVMDGYPMSPLQIVTAYMAREEGTYMRDYVIDPEGRIESLVFTDVNHNRQAEITP